jgi:hypothetical protein
MPEIIDPVFAKTSPKRSFSLTEYERFGLIFTKTRVYKFGHWLQCCRRNLRIARKAVQVAIPLGELKLKLKN